MSESDEDLIPSILKYPSDSTAINANPNFNKTNVTSYNFRSNMMTSTFNMHNLERQRYGMRGFDQRSMYYRRETSPMSLRSFPDSGMQNFHNSFYARGMSSQRSVFNGRSGSPVSMRSIDSNASVSAADIALAFKNVKFNKYDLRLIKDAYNKFMKNRVRKRIEKRRNLKLFLKGNRRRSGEDSGEQGSDSSISSDDCRSTRTTLYKENIPKSVHRPFKTDLSHLRSTIKESDMYKDCTENLKQNSLRNMFAVNSTLSQNHTSHEKFENSSTVTLKERFTKGTSFLLPSQRFNNKSTMKQVNTETSIRNLAVESKRSQETDSEKEEIFSENTVRENNTQQSQRKRVLETEDKNCSANKRNKTTISPIKNNDSSINTMQKNDFNFKKPQMPIRKTLNAKKDVVPERLIAKSRQPLNVSVELDLLINKNIPQISNIEDRCDLDIQNKDHPQNSTEIEPETNQSANTQNSNTDVSMRPSFLKRKLFTQNLDVAESKNISSDNLAVNSPQTKIYKECGEKNKVRKLVSSQSCLSRDVLGDDNVLDLIHKIVPPDQMNITSSTNRKELTKSNRESSDKWDVASVISMCNDNECSDTYTDEEIFKPPQNDTIKNNKEDKKEQDKQITIKSKVKEIRNQPKSKVQENKNKTIECKVVIQKLQPKNNFMNAKNELSGSQCQNKRTVSSCVKSFWDTDFESDVEDRSRTQWTSRCQVNQGKDIQKDTTNNSPKPNLNKRNVVKGTILTVRSFQNKCINSSMRSDISKVSKRKDPDNCQERKEENNNEMQNKNCSSKSTTAKETQNKVEPSSKITRNSKLNNELSKKSSEKPKAKPVKTKEAKPNNKTTKHTNNFNTSRESLRLKQKKENAKVNLSLQNNDSTTIAKRGRPLKKTKSDNSEPKNNQTPNKKSKEKSIKDKKSIKNPTIIHTLNKTRQTPVKGKEKKQLSSTITDESSLNITNISTRSLRIRRKVVK